MQFAQLGAFIANISRCLAAYQLDAGLDSIAVELCAELVVDWDCFRAAALSELLHRVELATCLSNWL